MAIVFNGDDLEVEVTAIGEYDAKEDIYSDWKVWMKTGDNAKYAPAFDTTGGDLIRAGKVVAPYFFMRNDLGWRVRAPMQDGEIDIIGNLLARDPAVPLFIPAIGYSSLLRLEISPQAVVVGVDDVQTTIAVLQAQVALLQKLLMNRMTTDPSTGDVTIYDDDNVQILLSGKVYEDVAGLIPYRAAGIDRRDRLVAP